MLLNPLALLGPALTKMLPSLLGGASSAGGAAGAAGASSGLGGLLSGFFGKGGASGGLSQSLKGLFGKSSGSALSASEIESMLAEGAFGSASGIFETADDETSSLVRGAAGDDETSFDARTGQAEARSHAAESAAAARQRRIEAGAISNGGFSGGGGFEGMAAQALGNQGDSGGSLLGQALLAGAAASGISKVTGTAGALFSAPLQVANSVVPDGNLKNAAAAGSSAASGLGKAAWSGITMDPQGWVEGMTQFTVGVIEGAKQLREFARGVAEGNRKLGDYNGNVALADATLEVNRIRRDIDFAQETGGSAAQTIRSEDRLEESLADLNKTLATLSNAIAIGVTEATKVGVDIVKMTSAYKALEDLAAVLEKLFPNADANALNDIFARIQAEAERRRKANDRPLS